MRTLAAVLIVLCAFGVANGQTAHDSAPKADSPTNDAAGAPSVGDEAPDAWSFGFTEFAYAVPEDQNYLASTFTADHGWLHLEARYNYEDLDTASVFAGYNFEVGEELTFAFTPMIGAVFGATDGIAPGYELSLSYGGFELYSEGEYVFDTHDSSESYFYTWTELTFSPADWCRAGVVIQRTRAYETDLDIQRGLLVGLSFENVDVTMYVFNPDRDEPTVVFSIGVGF